MGRVVIKDATSCPAGRIPTASSLSLISKRSVRAEPKPPFHFDANVHRPSHFPSSDNAWEPGRYWMTMRWRGKRLGIKLRNEGIVDDPKVVVTVFSKGALTDSYFDGVMRELAWRFNFEQDISPFVERFARDEFVGPTIEGLRGMKPVAGNSLYETLMVYVVLQNAVIRRSIQMLKALFEHLGRIVRFDGRALATFWTPREMMEKSEEELRSLKVGYRAKAFLRISEALAYGRIDETALRGRPKADVERTVSGLYGVGPASLSYLLFEVFHSLDELRVVPPWERKILSRLLFGRRLVPESRILKFFRSRYPGYERLAFDYLWEDLFWRREREHIEWLEQEIRR